MRYSTPDRQHIEELGLFVGRGVVLFLQLEEVGRHLVPHLGQLPVTRALDQDCQTF